MPNLDTSNLDTLTPEHYRVLTAVEMGLRNHDYVPLPLLCTIASISHGSVPRLTNDLLRIKLLTHVGGSADGYSLSYAGYDYLALKVLQRRGVVRELGSRIGVGKEADVYIGLAPDGSPVVLKFHKLGRTSFKTAKTKRDYMGHRQSASWMYLSRLAALREFGFMVALRQRGFSVPEPKSVNRHCVAMEHIEGAPMHTLRALTPALAQHLADLLYQTMVRMLSYGVVHGDCNEFNVIVQGFDAEALSDSEDAEDVEVKAAGKAGCVAGVGGAESAGSAEPAAGLSPAGCPGLAGPSVAAATSTISTAPVATSDPAAAPGGRYTPTEAERAIMQAMKVVVIDFPQMIQTTHPEAEDQFNRDVDSFVGFLNRRVHADIRVPRYTQALAEAEALRSQRLAEAAARSAGEGAAEGGSGSCGASGPAGGPPASALPGFGSDDIQATEKFVKDVAAKYDQPEPEDVGAIAPAGGAAAGGEAGATNPSDAARAEDGLTASRSSEEQSDEGRDAVEDGGSDEAAADQFGDRPGGQPDGQPAAQPAARRRREAIDVRAAVKRQLQKEENKRVQKARQRKGKSQGKPRLD